MGKIEEDKIGWENKMVGTGLIEKLTLVQRFGGGEELSDKEVWVKYSDRRKSKCKDPTTDQA